MKSQVRCLISTEEIDVAVAKLGEQISQDFAGKPLTILGILTGSVMLVADLMRRIKCRINWASFRPPATEGMPLSPAN